jgi:hypothetical protein
MVAVNFIWLEAAVLTLVFAITLHSGQSTIRSRNQTPKAAETSRYEDKDGIASEASQKAYSVKVQNIILTLFTTSGFLVALAQAVFATIYGWQAITETWIDFTIWVNLIPVFVQSQNEYDSLILCSRFSCCHKRS